MVNCNCGNIMDIIEEDSRQEWYEATYRCPECNKLKLRKVEYDQNGLVTSDELSDINEP